MTEPSEFLANARRHALQAVARLPGYRDCVTRDRAAGPLGAAA